MGRVQPQVFRGLAGDRHQRKDPLPEAEARDGETGKLEKYFSEAPGEGG